MLKIIIAGFLYSFVQNVAIGMQGAFVLKNGLRKNKIILSCLSCCLSDTVLIAVGIFLVSHIINVHPFAIKVFKATGIAILGYYAIRSFKSAVKAKNCFDINAPVIRSKKHIFATGVAVSVFNPQALTDTMVVLANLCINYNLQDKFYFFIGSASSSFVWFFSLGFAAKFFSEFFTKKIFWIFLDALIGLLMLILIFRITLNL